ncbi:MAG: CHC2 zinc finger domain-containing protein [Bacteroidota bacterium]
MSNRGIPKETAERIKERSKLEDIVTGLKKSGKDLVGPCPFCKSEKGLTVSPAKQIWKCFQCDKGGQGAVSYVMETENMKYPEALRYLADHYHMIIDEPIQAPRKQSDKKPRAKSFCDLQLESSGLTREDVMVTVKQDDKTTIDSPAFKRGTRTQYGDIIEGDGDDMLIYYYDLDGRPVMFKRDENSKIKHKLIRVRWQNPLQHQDRNGDTIKYQSPTGSGSHIYIPEKIRKLYHNTRKVKTLYIQEGEKKAEKCCKHGIPSVGVMGINNLGHQSKFPVELQLIIQRCEVEHVVFMLDSDWSDLSEKLKPGDRVDTRPKSFFAAVRNFKEYMLTLKHLGISLEIYFGYLHKSEKQEKGIDDLMAGTLKGNEETMAADLEKAIYDKEGEGKYVKVHKITQKDDKDIADLWLINDRDKFAERHGDILKELGEFTFRKMKWRFNDEGKVEMAQPLRPEEQYWKEEKRPTKSGYDRLELSFDYANCFTFLQNRGYWRIQMKSGEFRFVKIDGPVVEIVDNYHIKDFVTEFTRELDKKKDVLNMIYRGGPQYLGFEKLSNLQYVYPRFERAERTSQCLFFKEKIWEITHDGIKELLYAEMKNKVWRDKIIDFSAEVTDELLKVTRITEDNKAEYEGYKPGDFHITYSENGKKSDFLQFLINVSNFHWKKTENGEDLTPQEQANVNRHLLNKLTAIGFLLHDYKNDSELKAVIAMDGSLSEVGASEGRTGKSLIGMAIEFVIPLVYIAAKSKKLTEDNFLFGEVNEKTKIIFLDDVRANMDFEFFFPLITGKLKVNPKGGKPFTLGKEDTPKLFISTNHAINGDGSSFSDRQAFMAFSDFYNDNHKPVHDFHHNFFTEWDKELWNLFYNLMATCLMLYFRSLKEGWVGRGLGILDPPMENIRMRRLRQLIGEDFLTWADEYFDTEEQVDDLGILRRINRQIARKDAYDDLLEKNPNLRRWVTPTAFGKRIRAYCRFRGYHFNPTKPNKLGVEFPDFVREKPGDVFIGESDKSGGIEYITVATKDYAVF